jgi:hypothetical protein
MLVVAVAAVAALVAFLVAPTAAGPDASARTTSPTTPPAPAVTPAPAPAPKAPSSSSPARVDPVAQRELAALAAPLAIPGGLRSPVEWDQWLPEGKPFPGPSLEEEIATCPRLASRLTEALGQEMSYWTGTLPGGGCTWVPVPLEYDTPDYDYVISVGFLADGTTPESLVRGFATAGGPCPWIEAPTTAPGAVLVRCSTGTSGEHFLAVPDTRLPGGLWTLGVSVKDRAAVPASAIFPVLIEGTVAAFG